MSSHIAAPRILTDAAGSTSLRRGAWLQKKHQDVFRSKHGLKFTSIQAGASPALLKLLQRQSARNRDVYQFGVYTGVGLGKIASFLRGGFGQLWAFDSFQGIPEEPASENEALWTGDFRQGGYSAADALGVYDLESLVANIHQRVRRPNTTYVPGFFNVSLTDSLIRRAAGEGRPFQPARGPSDVLRRSLGGPSEVPRKFLGSSSEVTSQLEKKKMRGGADNLCKPSNGA